MTDTTDAIVEAMARAMALADGLNFDEVCGVDADPVEGYCDSGTCVSAHWEEHDAEQARRWYMHHARAALAAALPMLREVAGDILDPYVDSYKTMSRMGDGRVNCLSVHWDIKKNMAGYIRARFDELAKEIQAND